MDSADFAVFYKELGSIERVRRTVASHFRATSLAVTRKEEGGKPKGSGFLPPVTSASPTRAASLDASGRPARATRLGARRAASRRSLLKRRRDQFFGDGALLWDYAVAAPTPDVLEAQARALRDALTKLCAAATRSLPPARIGDESRRRRGRDDADSPPTDRGRGAATWIYAPQVRPPFARRQGLGAALDASPEARGRAIAL